MTQETMARGLAALRRVEAKDSVLFASLVVVQVGKILDCLWAAPPEACDEAWGNQLEGWLQVRDEAFAIFMEASGV